MTNESAIHLIHRAGQAATELFAVGSEGRTTARQHIVLAAIAGAKGEPSQTALVVATGIDRSTMADIVRRLVRAGLVTRQRRRADARAYALRLTHKGELAAVDAQRAAEAAETAILERVPVKLRGGFMRALAHIAQGPPVAGLAAGE